MKASAGRAIFRLCDPFLSTLFNHKIWFRVIWVAATLITSELSEIFNLASTFCCDQVAREQ